jgi:membrane protein involved in colicin uptake
MRAAAEARAQEAAAALAKSEQARQDAEAKAAAAAAAQAKAEQRAAEARASSAASALAISEQARRDAEAKAAAAADALAKSDQARRDAENAAAQARASAAQAKAAEPAPAARPASPSSPRTFLADIGSRSRWVIGSASCADAKKAYGLTIATASITWLSGEGNQDIESISSSSENEFRTITQSSAHMKPGQTWTYSRQGDRIRVDPGGRPAFMLTRCS